MRPWITLSKSSWIIITLVILLFASIAIPNLFPGFTSEAEPLTIRVRVTDRANGTPIQGAKVLVPDPHSMPVTDAQGECEAVARFLATGIIGRSGEMHIYGTIKVEAQDYQTWETPFASIVGNRYDYFHKGSSITYAVTLAK